MKERNEREKRAAEEQYLKMSDNKVEKVLTEKYFEEKGKNKQS